MLHSTATAARKMLALRLDTTFRGSDNFQHMGFIIVALLIVTAKLHRLSGQRTLDKTGFSIRTADTPTIVNKVDNLAN
jgi:hypothetical protein